MEIQIADRDGMSRCCQSLADGLPDPAGRPGDESHPRLNIHATAFLPAGYERTPHLI
jgi:hypothetical protein